MNTLYAMLLGAIQGFTEFVPISSTAHLILVEQFLALPQASLALNGSLHLGTAVALVVYFRKKLISFVITPSLQNKKLFTHLVIGTVPAIIIGLLFSTLIENNLQDSFPIALALIAVSFVFIAAERFQAGAASKSPLTPLKAVIIGVAQSIALIPGVSRSGITISTGMLLGLSRAQAAEFTFLLSIPVVFGAGGKLFISAFSSRSIANGEVLFFVIGMVAAFVVGYASLHFLLTYFKKHSLYPFVVYRMILGFILLAS